MDISSNLKITKDNFGARKRVNQVLQILREEEEMSKYYILC